MKKLIKSLLLLLRIPIFRLKGSSVNVHSDIKQPILLRNTRVEPYVHIGPYCIINNAEIGSYSSIAPQVQIGGMEHPYWDVSTSTYLSDEARQAFTSIGHDVWIGAAAIIKAGVKIGNGAVVGANSFVNKDVPPYAIVIGSPAKVYKFRFDDTIIAELEASRYWENEPSKARNTLSKITIKKNNQLNIKST